MRSPPSRASDEAGYRVGVAGNQPQAAEALFRGLDVPLDLVASSETLGVEKPDPRFFAAVAERLALTPAEVAYVGDRLDNDVRPAAAAGMRAIFLRRGPWAWVQAGRDPVPEAAATIDDLASIVDVVRGLSGAGGSGGWARARAGLARSGAGGGGPAEDAHLRLGRRLEHLEAQQAIRHLGEVSVILSRGAISISVRPSLLALTSSRPLERTCE